MDTANDYRILVCEATLNKLMKLINASRIPYPVKKEKAVSSIRELHSSLMAIKYCYLPASELTKSDLLKDYESKVFILTDALSGKPLKKLSETEELVVDEVMWALNFLKGLRSRLELGEDNKMEYAVDVLGAEVVSVSKHPNADALWVTRAETFDKAFTVVTNIPDIRKGEIRCVALLPPVNLRGVVSEAMYCSKPLDSSFKGRRIPSDKLEVKELRMQIEQFLKRFKA